MAADVASILRFVGVRPPAEVSPPANKRTARRVLRDWIARARASGIRMLSQFAATLLEHQGGILAYCDYPISTGPLEGTNTKIQAMKRQAYGVRDHEFYKLKILGIHETKHALDDPEKSSMALCETGPNCALSNEGASSSGVGASNG